MLWYILEKFKIREQSSFFFFFFFFLNVLYHSALETKVAKTLYIIFYTIILRGLTYVLNKFIFTSRNTQLEKNATKLKTWTHNNSFLYATLARSLCLGILFTINALRGGTTPLTKN